MAGKKMFRTEDFQTDLGRLSYAESLYAPRSIKNSAPKYGCTLIFPIAYKSILEKKLAEVLIGEWKDLGIARARAGLIRSPLLAGDGKEARNKETGELKPGMGSDVFFIRVHTGTDLSGKPIPPFVTWRNPNIQETIETVYSGCYGKAVLNAFAWHFDDTNSDGVSFGLAGFQKLREGEKLGGDSIVRDPAKFHEKIEGAEDAPASTKGGDGAGGLFG